MLALFLFAVVEEDVDESAGAAVEDMEVLTTLDAAQRWWRRQRPCELH